MKNDNGEWLTLPNVARNIIKVVPQLRVHSSHYLEVYFLEGFTSVIDGFEVSNIWIEVSTEDEPRIGELKFYILTIYEL